MPIYKYECECGFKVRQMQKEPKSYINCPMCGGKAKRQFGNIGIAFRGKDFYVNSQKPEGGINDDE